MARVTIKGREFLEDVRSGLSKTSLQRKYGLSASGLERAWGKMVEQGLLNPSDIDSCKWYEPTSVSWWTCPACGRPQGRVWDVCPACGVIVSKFEPKPQIDFQKQEPEQPPPTDWNVPGTLATNASLLRRDGVFWSMILFAVLPLGLTMSPVNMAIAFNSFLAAGIWAVVFKTIVVKDPGGWAAPIWALLFTSLTGVGMLLAVYCFMPESYTALKQSKESLVSLSGWVLQVGICEELCKAFPPVVYILWKKARKEQIKARTVIVVAIFSATGFAATENIDYAIDVAWKASLHGANAGQDASACGVKAAMLNFMLRAVSLVFGHAVYSGIFGCLLALAAYSRRWWPILILVGLGLSAGLHGLYDWLVHKHMGLAALADAVGFMIFYTLVMKASPKTKSEEDPVPARG